MAGTPKQILNLPSKSDASEREIQDGMYYDNPGELYNDGSAFKLTFRDSSGVVVTVLADNYFGYCKKEVKTQVSFAANLSGLSEEEHAGGAVVFPSYDLGEEFEPLAILPKTPHTFEDTTSTLGISETDAADGVYCDPTFDSIFYLPENAKFSLREQEVSWTYKDNTCNMALDPRNSYVLPSGYKVEMKKTENDGPWKLVGTVGEGFFVISLVRFQVEENLRFQNLSLMQLYAGLFLLPIGRGI